VERQEVIAEEALLLVTDPVATSTTFRHCAQVTMTGTAGH